MSLHDLYKQPTAPVAEHLDQTAPTRMAPRPYAVWLFIVVLFIFLCATLIELALFGSAPLSGQTPMGAGWTGMGWRLVVMSAVVAFIRGLYRRRAWARWIAVLFIGAVAVVLVLQRFDPLLPTSRATFRHPAEFAFAELILVSWVYCLGFSSKARRYFAGRAPEPS